MSEPAGRYGEKVVSWQNVWNDLFPQDPPEWHDDDAAEEMHGLRGLHHLSRAEQRLALGKAYQDHGLVFARPEGQPWEPDAFTSSFRKAARAAGFGPLALS